MPENAQINTDFSKQVETNILATSLKLLEIVRLFLALYSTIVRTLLTVSKRLFDILNKRTDLRVFTYIFQIRKTLNEIAKVNDD